MRVGLLLTCLAVVLALAAAAPIPASYIGNWYSATCESSPIGYGKRYVEFQNNFWTLRYDFYMNDNTCTNLAVTMDIIGWAAANVGTPTPVAGATAVDLQIGARLIRPTSTAGVSFINTACNVTHFSLNGIRDTASEYCPGFGLAPLSVCGVEYEIIALSTGGALQFGTVSPALCAPATRPTTFVPDVLLPVTLPTLRGIYSTGCKQTSETSSYIVDTTFTDVYFAQATTTFADASCTNTMLSIYTEGNYRMFAPVSNIPGAVTIETALISSSMLLSAVPSVANTTLVLQTLCPGHDWPREQYIDLRTYNCSRLNLVPLDSCPVLYDIVSWTNGNVYPGFSTTLPCTAAARPTTLATLGSHLVGYTVSPLVTNVITAAIAFAIGAILFGVIMGCCCRGRGGNGSGGDNYTAYSQPLTSR